MASANVIPARIGGGESGGEDGGGGEGGGGYGGGGESGVGDGGGGKCGGSDGGGGEGGRGDGACGDGGGTLVLHVSTSPSSSSRRRRRRGTNSQLYEARTDSVVLQDEEPPQAEEEKSPQAKAEEPPQAEAKGRVHLTVPGQQLLLVHETERVEAPVTREGLVANEHGGDSQRRRRRLLDGGLGLHHRRDPQEPERGEVKSKFVEQAKEMFGYPKASDREAVSKRKLENASIRFN